MFDAYWRNDFLCSLHKKSKNVWFENLKKFFLFLFKFVSDSNFFFVFENSWLLLTFLRWSIWNNLLVHWIFANDFHEKNWVFWTRLIFSICNWIYVFQRILILRTIHVNEKRFYRIWNWCFEKKRIDLM